MPHQFEMAVRYVDRDSEHLKSNVEMPGPDILLVSGNRTDISPSELARDPSSTQSLSALDQRSILDVSLDRDGFEILAILYALGAEVRLVKRKGDQPPRTVELPVYPYDDEDYWLADVDVATTESPNVDVASFGDWFQDWRWHPRSPRLGVPRTKPSTCLVFSADNDCSRALVDHLRMLGNRVIEVLKADERYAGGVNRMVIDPHRPAGFWHLLKKLDLPAGETLSIVHLWSSATAEQDSATRDPYEDIEGLFYLLQAMARWGKEHAIELRWVSRGAQRITSDRDCRFPIAASAWGMLRSAARELSNIRCQSIDMDPYCRDGGIEARRLAGELTSSIQDVELAFLGDGVYVPGLHAHDVQRSSQTVLRKRGTYWITGGLGGIGFELAQWLWKRYGAKIVLTSRSPLSTNRREHAVVQEMRSQGAEILALTADVADKASMEEAMRTIREQFGPVHGVFHAAGSVRVGRLAHDTWEEFKSVLRPKMEGSLVLDSILDAETDFLVLFSSVAGLLGNVFQADYSAANRFLDSFAAWRTARGKRTLSIDWGIWRDVGMGVHLVDRDSEHESNAIPTEQGLAALERVLSCPESQIIVAPHFSLPAMLADSTLACSVDAKSLEGILRTELAAVLACAPERLDSMSSFVEFGLDSILAVQFIRRVGSRLGAKLSVTLPFDFPSLRTMAAHLASEGISFSPSHFSAAPVNGTDFNGLKGSPDPTENGAGANTVNSAGDMILLRSGRRVTKVQRSSR
ncbi:MAG: SDR family NAD(P)-dependent oxidoreductase [Planctomycetota bacterium]